MKSAFSLIEVLVVIAIVAILATAIIVAINPGTRSAQARDAIRKQHIGEITNAIISYQAIKGVYPGSPPYNAWGCDSSLGLLPTKCPVTGNNWQPQSNLIVQLVNNESLLRSLPKDPINSLTNGHYYYAYFPSLNGANSCGQTAGNICNSYWIGVELEQPADPNKPIYRCSDYPNLPNGPGCIEVGPASLMESSSYRNTLSLPTGEDT